MESYNSTPIKLVIFILIVSDNKVDLILIILLFCTKQMKRIYLTLSYINQSSINHQGYILQKNKCILYIIMKTKAETVKRKTDY